MLHKKLKKLTNEEGEIVEEEEKDDQSESARPVIEHLSFTIFGPIFFLNLGGKLVFDNDVVLRALPAVIVLYSTVFVLQVAAAALAPRFTGTLWKKEGVALEM